ncbi:MAG: hypothetical protein GY801_00890 [bacterium]|nr:hypothetical protein [bacterium]
MPPDCGTGQQAKQQIFRKKTEVKVMPSKPEKDIHQYGGVALVLQDFFQTLPTKSTIMETLSR